MPSRACIVSFTDTEGVIHTAEVSAASLYEAAALAIAEFRKCLICEVAPGPASTLKVAVKAPAAVHEVTVNKVRAWISGGTRSPAELVLKKRLKELLKD